MWNPEGGDTSIIIHNTDIDLEFKFFTKSVKEEALALYYTDKDLALEWPLLNIRSLT